MTDNLFGLQSALIFALFVLIIFFRPIDINIAQPPIYDDSLIQNGDVHFNHPRQLTFSGENAEADFSSDGKSLVFQSHDDSSNFGQYYFPNGKRIIFSSNLHDPKERDFDLYAINTDGTDLERITHFDGFDGFPMFSSDGKYLVFASNRNQVERGNKNLFILEWKKL